MHFIDTNWELKSHCLQTHYLAVVHTGANIAEAFEDTIQQWDLEADKLVGVATDSGSNIKSACNQLGWDRLSCYGHNLNTAVRKGLNDRRVQHVCRNIVSAFSRS